MKTALSERGAPPHTAPQQLPATEQWIGELLVQHRRRQLKDATEVISSTGVYLRSSYRYGGDTTAFYSC